MAKKITIPEFKIYKQENRRFTMLTVYDYTTAKIVDESNVEAILVGDSIGNIVYGFDSTTPVTLDMMILATRAVVKGAPNTFIVGDLPFGTYNVSCQQAIESANRMMKEGGCDCVKLEGGIEMADKIEAIVKSGTPVMGHIGLTPQTAASAGGMKVQGKTPETAKKLIEEIKAIEKAGAFCCLVECVPVGVGKAMSEAVEIPMFSGGSGPYGTGHGQNFYDMFGFFGRAPKFVKHFGEYREQFVKGLNEFRDDVNNKVYPAPEQCYNVVVEGFEIDK